MEELKKHIYDEHNGLNYTLVGDYYISENCWKKLGLLGVGDGCTETIWSSTIRSTIAVCFYLENSGLIWQI